jgi:biopolymer transport protein ExbD
MKTHSRRRRLKFRPAKSDINITPLIDVLLVLLVIFMVITPVNSTGLGTNVPQPASDATRIAPNEPIVLSIDRDSRISINREAIDSTMLSARLREIMQSRADRTMFVQGDSNLDFNEVAHVIDVAKGAGAERIGLMTEAR